MLVILALRAWGFREIILHGEGTGASLVKVKYNPLRPRCGMERKKVEWFDGELWGCVRTHELRPDFAPVCND